VTGFALREQLRIRVHFISQVQLAQMVARAFSVMWINQNPRIFLSDIDMDTGTAEHCRVT